MINQLFFCVEDPLGRAVMLRLFGCLLGIDDKAVKELDSQRGGVSEIKKKFNKYCNLANRNQVFILIDLDNAVCPPSLREKWINESSLSEPLPSKLSLNIADTEVESWLIADRENLSNFLGIPKQKLSYDTEFIHPKEHLLQCVRNYGNNEAKYELLPCEPAKVGAGYNAHLCNFVAERWDFISASGRNASLRRTVKQIMSIK